MHKHPIIGITSGLNAEETYHSLSICFQTELLKRGCIPVILPLTNDPDILKDICGSVNGVLFSPGCDIDPEYFGEETRSVSGAISPMRDAAELALAKRVHGLPNIPVLGICRGMQVMNVALGGSIYQDLEHDFPSPVLAHRQKQPSCYPSHRVSIKQDTLLSSILGKEALRVNSLHHQAARDVPDGLQASAYSSDGVIEAVESISHPFYLGLQWHPERTTAADRESNLIFDAFCLAAHKSQAL